MAIRTGAQLTIVAISVIGALVPFTPARAADKRAAEYLVYIGTYTRDDSQGIYVCSFDTNTGELGPPRVAASAADTKIKNPSFLAIPPGGQRLYAVSEVDDHPAPGGGAVAAFSIGADAALTLLNHQPSAGAGPCHLSLDRDGRTALVANYGSGSVASLPIGSDGKLAAPVSTMQHEGSSVNRQRQEAPHAHSINLDPKNRFALAADLGTDEVVSYRFNAQSGALEQNDAGTFKTPAGAGPRHLAFHPNGRWVYVNGELISTIMALDYNDQNGSLVLRQQVSTLPEDVDASQNTTAEVQVHPNGKTLYVSNRGHDSIAMFAIDAEEGSLRPLGYHPTGGHTPRNFGIDPTGAWLVAANQDSGTVTVHRISDDGTLSATERQAAIPWPVCVKFLAR
ncbi:MAG: 6-phosphogluconolactonase [Planctomycetota bacterium]|nr:MAG: 6-phosphogluconolactonase [Planctomycetota bacterium]